MFSAAGGAPIKSWDDYATIINLVPINSCSLLRYLILQNHMILRKTARVIEIYGMGSGRYLSGAPTRESTHSIDLAYLRRRGFL